MTATPDGGDACTAPVVPDVDRDRGRGRWSTVIPAHESAVRRLAADAAGTDYRALRSLAEARDVDDGVVVVEGDLGGVVYAVFPAALVACSEERLVGLARDLDARLRPGSGAGGGTGEAAVYFERHGVGAAIAGGAGGGVVLPGGWVHDELVQIGIEHQVFAVVDGTRERLGPAG